MRQRQNYGDARQTSWCAYCGHPTGTRDHVPAEVFLDTPYPENLPAVGSCEDCNMGVSLDEEYVACLIECLRMGSTRPDRVERPRIRRILEHSPALAARLETARAENNGAVAFSVEHDRVRDVILKLARGHALFELNEPHWEEPAAFSYEVLHTLSPEVRERFEKSPAASIWPEVGSRSMHLLVEVASGELPWLVVQPRRYRYMTWVSGGVGVRVVLSEYLACEAVWQS